MSTSFYIAWYDDRSRVLDFTSENNWVSYANHADFNFYTQDFGIGIVFYPSSNKSSANRWGFLLSHYGGSMSSDTGWMLRYDYDNERLCFNMNDGNSAAYPQAYSATGSYPLDTWSYAYIRVERTVGVEFFRNGAQVTTQSDSTSVVVGSIYKDAQLKVGGYGNGNVNNFCGWIGPVQLQPELYMSDDWIYEYYLTLKYQNIHQPSYIHSTVFNWEGSLDANGIENVTLEDLVYEGTWQNGGTAQYSTAPSSAGYWFPYQPPFESSFLPLDSATRTLGGRAKIYYGSDADKERYVFRLITQDLATRYLIEGAYAAGERLGIMKDINTFTLDMFGYMSGPPQIETIKQGVWSIQFEVVEE